MEPEEGTSIFEFTALFFDRYNISEMVFFYIILQLLFWGASFKKSDIFDQPDLGLGNRSLPSQLIVKPIFMMLYVLLLILFSALYTAFIAICFQGILQWIPDIWEVIFAEKIFPLEFDFGLAVIDGCIFLLLSYLVSYCINRNNEIQIQAKAIRDLEEFQKQNKPNN